MSNFDIISDRSKEKLLRVPEDTLEMSNLKMLFLEGNLIPSLPHDFFIKLPKLTWLDLRNNQLRDIPTNIAFHKHLECLFLTNNLIEKLPNEVGLVPNLKALQVANNPLIHPPKAVVSEGTNAIKSFLKEQYSLQVTASLPIEEHDDEILLNVVDEDTTSKKDLSDLNYQSTASDLSKIIDNLNRIQPPPAIQVKQLSRNTNTKPLLKPQAAEEPIKIVHKLNRSRSKISLKSYFKKVGVQQNLGPIMDTSVKENWLNKLRILLNDQERILQQERNLRTLSSWRCDTKKYERNENLPKPPPFATYTEFSKIPTREELNKQLNSFAKEKLSYVRKGPPQKLEIDALINDLVRQLRGLESTYTEMKSPRSEIEDAGKQIKAIMEIHKKLILLQSSNDATL